MVSIKLAKVGKSDGFTIVEVMIVTLVTALIFASSILVISGQQNKSEFSTAVQEFQTRLQQVVDDVINGYYPITTPFKCVTTSGRPVITPDPTASRGSNADCIFLGKVVQMGVGAAKSPTFHIYPVVGKRFDVASQQEVCGLGVSATCSNSAQPAVLADNSVAAAGQGLSPVSVDDFETDALENGVTIQPHTIGNSGMYYNNDPSAQISALAFVSSFGQYDATSNLISQSQQVSLFAVVGSVLGHTKDQDVTYLDQTLSNGAVTIQPSSVEICLQSGGTSKSALITIGNNGHELAVTPTIKDSGDLYMKGLRRERGDTIVEVLIAIIIVSSVLAGVYTTARLGLTATRQSQERSEGLKLAEAQVEGLRASATNAASPIFKQTNVFCLDSTNTPLSVYTTAATSPVIGQMTTVVADTGTNYSTACSPKATVSVADITYNVSIDACDGANAASSDCAARGVCGSTDSTSAGCSAAVPSLFVVRARWDRAGGGGREEVTLLYRVYPLSAGG